MGEWISVKDRPPEISGDGPNNRGILIADANGNIHLTRALIEMKLKGAILYFDDSHRECFWTIMGGETPYYNTLIKGNEIVYWMPLPELPKEAGE